MSQARVVLKMWTVLCVFALVNYCSTAPGGSLDDLIDGLLDKTTPTTTTTGTKISGKPADNIDDLIDEIFRPSNGSGSNSKPIDGNGTILGPKNTLPPNDNCECVPYYQCQEGSILDNGVGLIDIRSNFDDIHEKNPR